MSVSETQNDVKTPVDTCMTDVCGDVRDMALEFLDEYLSGETTEPNGETAGSDDVKNDQSSTHDGNNTMMKSQTKTTK